MSKLIDKIITDVESFSVAGIEECAVDALVKVKKKTDTIKPFKNNIKDNTNIDRTEKNIRTVYSGTQGHAQRFELGYQNSEERITPLLREWAEKRKVKIGENQKTMKVDYQDNDFHQAHRFMSKSIPTEAEVKSALDRVIKSTIRGGTIYG